MTTSNLLWVIGCMMVVAGFAGIVLPALPGAVLIFVGMVLAAWADGFERVGPVPLIVIGLIAAATYAVDFVASALGAKHAGASPRAMAGAALGTLLGLFIGLPGLILGPLVGAVVGEWSKHRDLARAGRVGAAAWLGFLLGNAVKIALAFSMLAIFIAAMLLF